MRRITASVVMYGRAGETHRCIESIAEHTKVEDFRLYLIDNDSPDRAYQKMKGMGYPDCVKLFREEKNRGFGAGHNVVLPFIKSRYHAVINPDITLHDDALAQMADWMDKHPDVVMATPHMVFPDGKDQPLPKRRPALLPLLARQLKLRSLKKHEEHYLMLDEDLSEATDVEFCSGAFFLMRTDTFKAIGGFDEKYFMYVEDADITQKALKRGRAVYLPQVTVAHAWHREAHTNPRKFFWQVKSMLRYFRKWGFKLK